MNLLSVQKKLYVSNGGSNTVSVIDTTSRVELTKIKVGNAPGRLVYSPISTKLYVSNN